MNLNFSRKLIPLFAIAIIAMVVVDAKKNKDKKDELQKVEPEYTNEEKTEFTLEQHVKTIVKKQKPMCRKGLLRAYGLLGRKYPEDDERMKVCPTVDYSCCQEEDELFVVQTVEKDIKNFKERVNYQFEIVKDLDKFAKKLCYV